MTLFKGDIKIPKKILGNEIYKGNSDSKEDSKYCPVCNKTITKSNLKRHIKRFHEGANMDLVSNEEMKEEAWPKPIQAWPSPKRNAGNQREKAATSFEFGHSRGNNEEG